MNTVKRNDAAVGRFSFAEHPCPALGKAWDIAIIMSLDVTELKIKTKLNCLINKGCKQDQERVMLMDNDASRR